MSKFKLVILFLYLTLNTFAINKVDSLKIVVDNKSGNKKLEAYLELAKELSYGNNGDSTIYYGNKSLELGTQLNKPYAIAASNLYISAGYFSKKNYNKSRIIAQKGALIAKQIKHKKLQLQLSYMIARTYQKEQNYMQAIMEFKQIWTRFSSNLTKEKTEQHIINYLKATLKQLSYTYYFAGKLKEGILYFKQIETTINSIPFNLKRGIYSNAAFLYSQGNDLNKAEKYILKSIKISEKLNILGDLYQDYAYLAIICHNTAMYQKTIKYCKKAFEIATKQKSDKNKTWVLTLMGKTNFFLGNIKNALDINYNCLKIHNKNNDLLGQAFVQNNFGEFLLKWNDTQSSKKHIAEAINIYKKLKMKSKIASSYKMMCRIYLKENKIDSLVYYNNLLEKSLQIVNDKYLYCDYLYFNGIINYTKYQNTTKALKYIKESLEVSLKNKRGQSIYLNYHILSKIYLENNKTNLALKNIKEAWKYINKMHSLADKKMITEQMANCYESLNQKDSVVKYFKITHKLNKDIFKQENTIALYQKERLVELDKIKSENKSLLNKNKSIYTNLIRYRYLILIVFILLIIVFVFFKTRNKRIKKIIHIKEKQSKEFQKLAEYDKAILKLEISDLENKYQDLKDLLSKIQETNIHNNLVPSEANLHNLKNKPIATQEAWENFIKSFNLVYPNFFFKLRDKYIDLSQNDERILALVKLKLKSKEMANVLCVSVYSLNTARYRLRKKIGLNKADKLEDVVEGIE